MRHVPRKRTLLSAIATSVLCQKRTSRTAILLEMVSSISYRRWSTMPMTAWPDIALPINRVSASWSPSPILRTAMSGGDNFWERRGHSSDAKTHRENEIPFSPLPVGEKSRAKRAGEGVRSSDFEHGTPSA